MAHYWVAVASKLHVDMGINEQFAQICHGKVGPLNKMSPGDQILYYSPTFSFGDKKPYQKFTALGTIQEEAAYQHPDDRLPWRRHTVYKPVHEVAIRELIPSLSFIKNKKYWGMAFRRGIFSIPQEDFLLITRQMGLKNTGS